MKAALAIASLCARDSALQQALVAVDAVPQVRSPYKQRTLCESIPMADPTFSHSPRCSICLIGSPSRSLAVLDQLAMPADLAVIAV